MQAGRLDRYRRAPQSNAYPGLHADAMRRFAFGMLRRPDWAGPPRAEAEVAQDEAALRADLDRAWRGFARARRDGDFGAMIRAELQADEQALRLAAQLRRAGHTEAEIAETLCAAKASGLSQD